MAGESRANQPQPVIPAVLDAGVPGQVLQVKWLDFMPAVTPFVAGHTPFPGSAAVHANLAEWRPVLPPHMRGTTVSLHSVPNLLSAVALTGAVPVESQPTHIQPSGKRFILEQQSIWVPVQDREEVMIPWQTGKPS